MKEWRPCSRSPLPVVQQGVRGGGAFGTPRSSALICMIVSPPFFDGLGPMIGSAAGPPTRPSCRPASYPDLFKLENESLASAVTIGCGATLVMDVWALGQRLLLGIASLDYAMVGRWLGHIPMACFAMLPSRNRRLFQANARSDESRTMRSASHFRRCCVACGVLNG
jgi:hypothetical protein